MKNGLIYMVRPVDKEKAPASVFLQLSGSLGEHMLACNNVNWIQCKLDLNESPAGQGSFLFDHFNGKVIVKSIGSCNFSKVVRAFNTI